jgi:hypothetical protein
MIDTVPAGVQLTEVITPLPVKPQNIILLFAGDTIQFSGEVRVRIWIFSWPAMLNFISCAQLAVGLNPRC